MSNSVTVEVKQEHILKGRRRAKCGCPIALALRDMGFEHPSVSPLQIVYHIGLNTVMCKVPDIVNQFILAFDVGECVEPFSFGLERLND